MSITMRDIGRKAGVSIATVSYVLNNKPSASRISAETKEKILKVAKELNYRPNLIAISLQKKKTKTIGVVFTNAIGTFMNEIINGIERSAHQQGYNLFVCTSDDNWRKEANHIRTLRERRVDGMIVFPVACRKSEKAMHEHLLQTKKDGIPLVLIDRYLPGTDIDYVVGDDLGGAYDAVTHLIKLGHKRIAHITRPIECTSVQNRLEGYKKALCDAGLEISKEYIKVADYLEGNNYSGYNVTKDLLKMGKERPTAIFTVTDGEPIDGFRAIREAGLIVPDDIAVVGFGDDEKAPHLEVPLTTVTQPKSEMGEKGAAILINRIENPESARLEQTAIKPKLVIRQSCGARKAIVTGDAVS